MHKTIISPPGYIYIFVSIIVTIFTCLINIYIGILSLITILYIGEHVNQGKLFGLIKLIGEFKNEDIS